MLMYFRRHDLPATLMLAPCHTHAAADAIAIYAAAEIFFAELFRHFLLADDAAIDTDAAF